MVRLVQQVYLDFTGLSFVRLRRTTLHPVTDLMKLVVEKVLDAFKGTNVCIVLEPPKTGCYSTVVIDNIRKMEGDWVGIAISKDGPCMPTDFAIVTFEKLCEWISNFELEEAGNFLANTIVHEIGHTLGLDHVDDLSDVMYWSVKSDDWRLPPKFTRRQLQAINTDAVISNYPVEGTFQQQEDATSQMSTQELKNSIHQGMDSLINHICTNETRFIPTDDFESPEVQPAHADSHVDSHADSQVDSHADSQVDSHADPEKSDPRLVGGGLTIIMNLADLLKYRKQHSQQLRWFLLRLVKIPTRVWNSLQCVSRR